MAKLTRAKVYEQVMLDIEGKNWSGGYKQPEGVPVSSWYMYSMALDFVIDLRAQLMGLGKETEQCHDRAHIYNVDADWHVTCCDGVHYYEVEADEVSKTGTVCLPKGKCQCEKAAQDRVLHKEVNNEPGKRT